MNNGTLKYSESRFFLKNKTTEVSLLLFAHKLSFQVKVSWQKHQEQLLVSHPAPNQEMQWLQE